MNQFSVIAINPKDQVSHDVMNDVVKLCVSKVLPVSYVDYDVFRKGTSEKSVPLFIMTPRNDNRVEQKNEFGSLKGKFNPVLMAGNYSAPMTNPSNPRYGILDVHSVSVENKGIRFMIRISMNKIIPLSYYKINSEIARLLSMQMSCILFNLGDEANCTIEAVDVWNSGHNDYHCLTRAGTGLIGKYTTQNKISINEMLRQMDDNIEKLMASKDLVEYEEMQEIYYKSLEFLEKQGMIESKEYYSTKKQININEMNIQKARKLVTEEPNVTSTYFRIYNPRDLERFKKTEVTLKAGEDVSIWGNLEQ